MSIDIEQLLDAIDRLARELPPPLVHAIAAKLASMERPMSRGDLIQLGGGQQGQNWLSVFEELLIRTESSSYAAIALALRSALNTAEKLSAGNAVEIAWTGPGTSVIPVRRVDQVMYELVEGARREILLASFVTWGAATAFAALHAATQRGVEVTLILESALEAVGKLSFDGLVQIRNEIPNAAIYVWPWEKRQVSSLGKKGVLHVKCLVCDAAHALVSSANLTHHGLELNMELGLLIHGIDIPRRLVDHFRQLIRQGELRRWG